MEQVSSHQSTTAPWCAIRVRARAEKVTLAYLLAKGYESFVPLYSKRAEWSDRLKEIQSPLFPGYVFCRLDANGKPPVICTPGVIGILGFGGKFAIISDREIDEVRSVTRSGVSAEPWPYLREGEQVRVKSGLLTGIEGVLIRTKSKWRVVLSVEALCRSIAIEIDREATVPAGRGLLMPA